MNIVILGAGQVGSSLAINLQKEHDITIIDEDSEKLSNLQSHFDLRTICGSASDPTVLDEAGASDTDMIIAVTNNDEANIVACQIAYSLYKVPTKIARLRNKNYVKYPQIFNSDNIPIDFIINPAEYVTKMLIGLIEHPGSFQVVDFAKGKLQMVGTVVAENSPVVGMSIREFRQELPDIDARIMAIFRHKQSLLINADTIIEANDELFFLAEQSEAAAILAEFQPHVARVRKLFIAGAGNIGVGLAKRLENNYDIKIIESDYQRCYAAAEKLNNTTVLNGNASDTELLASESIDDMDLFCSVTNDDETNIMSAMIAKKMGAKNTMALVNGLSYAMLVDDSSTIDRAISPQRITIGVIQTYLRKGDVTNIYSLYGGKCEAMEIKVHGDERSSMVAGKSIEELNLPDSIRIGALVRNNQVMIAHDHYVIEANDRVVLTVTDLSKIPTVEKLFQVSPFFL